MARDTQPLTLQNAGSTAFLPKAMNQTRDGRSSDSPGFGAFPSAEAESGLDAKNCNSMSSSRITAAGTVPDFHRIPY